MIQLFAYWSAASLAAALPYSPDEVVQASVFSTSGPLINYDFDDPKRIWIQSFDHKARYSIAKPTAGEIAQLTEVLNAAYDARLSMTIDYDAAAGTIDEGSSKIVYPLCSVRLDEKVFTSRHACMNGPIKIAAARPTLLLSIGHAQMNDENWAGARRLLTRVLQSPKITPATRRIALHSRGGASETAADDGVWTSPESDRLLIASLADYRALAALDPSDSQSARNVAHLLGLLGDNEAAMAAYRDSVKKWPDTDGKIDISMAALARNSGNSKESLRLLDVAWAKNPDGHGMRYHYHRGWTLTQLDRFDEAIAAFSEGMKTQPDYSWAYIKRGCAHAQVGQHARALDDVERGIALAAKLPPVTVTAAISANERRRGEIRILLQQAVASQSTAPLPQACNGFAGPNESIRSKSKLLD